MPTSLRSTPSGSTASTGTPTRWARAAPARSASSAPPRRSSTRSITPPACACGTCRSCATTYLPLHRNSRLSGLLGTLPFLRFGEVLHAVGVGALAHCLLAFVSSVLELRIGHRGRRLLCGRNALLFGEIGRAHV